VQARNIRKMLSETLDDAHRSPLHLRCSARA
jgi:hypothetical protein